MRRTLLRTLIFFISFTATVICPIYAANNLWVGPPGGLWSNPFNWSGGVPGPTDTVQIITAGDNVNLDVVAPIIQDLEITADADLTAGGIRLITVSGYVTVTTTGTYDDANIFIRMTGVGTINASQTLGPLEVDPGAGNTVTIMTNNLDLSSTLDITTGTLDTGIQNLTVASTCTINGILDFAGAGGNILTLNGTLDCNGTLDASGNGNITSTGNVDFTVGNFSKGTGTFTFSSGGAQTLISALEDLGNIQVSAAFTNLILNDAANFDAVTVNFGTTLDASVAGSDITVQGDWSNTGVFSCGTNMVTFSGPNDPQTLASGGDNFYDVTVAKTAKTDTLQLTANLIQTAGGALSFTGGEIDLNTRTWQLGAALNVTADTQFTVGAGTLNGNTNNVNVTFDGGDVSVAGGSITCNAFTVTDNGAAPDTALTMTGTGSVTANGNMIIQAPTSLVDGNLQTSGTFTVTDTAPFNGSVTGTGTGGVRVIGGANLSTINGNVTLANGAFDVDGNLTVGATYTLQITGAGAFTVDGTTSITGTVTTANAASTFTGNVDSSGTFNVGGTGNVTFSGTYGALTSTGTVALLNTGSILFTGAADFTGGTLTGSLGGNPTIEFRGNVIFGTFTHNNDVVLFSGGTTPQTFNSNGQILFTTNIIKSAGANIVRLTGNLTITDANLNINTGTLDLNGFTLTVNDTTAAAGDITIGAAGTLDASVAGGHITIQGDWSNGGSFLSGTNTVTFNGGVLQDLDAGGLNNAVKDFNNIAVNIAGTTLRLNATDCEINGTLTLSATASLNMNGRNIDLHDNLTINLGSTWTPGAGILTLEAALSLTDSTGGPQNLGNVTVVGNPVTQASAIQVADLTINAAAQLNSAGFALYVSRDWNSAGIYTPGANTVFFNGTSTLGNNETFNNLTIQAGASLDIATHTLTVTGVYNNLATLRRNAAATAPQDINSGLVIYYGGAGTIQDYGAGNDYYDLEIEGAGAFSIVAGNDLDIARDLFITGGSLDANGRTITIGRNFDSSGGGTFTHNSGEVIFLAGGGTSTILGSNTFYNFTCITANAIILFEAASTQTIVAGGTFHIDGIAPATPIDLDSTFPGIQWFITIMAGASVNMQFVNVDWSNATIPIVVPPNVTVTVNCTNWLSTVPVTASSTIDNFSQNGRIDRILVQVAANINYDFTDFQVMVTGYQVTGYSAGPNPDEFYIHITEKTVMDTDATPNWWIETNTTLLDSATLTKLAVSLPGPGGETPTDAAVPLVGYSLAVADKDEIYIKFSEPVYDQTAPITAIDENFFIYSGGANINGMIFSTTVVTGYGTGTTEILLTLDANVTAPEVIAPPATIDINNNVRDQVPQSIPNEPHRVTDVGLGLVGNGIMEPLWARDETQRDSIRGGIGLLKKFDGSGWLRDQTITLQAHIHSGLGAGPVMRLHYDPNVPSSLKSNGLWLPDPFVYGLIPGPNTDTRQVNESGATGQLRDFILPNPASDSEFKDGALVEFFFEDAASPGLYHGRIINDSASDWYRYVRPWSFKIRDVRVQRGDVTILSNVINPTQGQTTKLHYTIDQAGMVTIQVFDLEGDIIDVLYRGRRNPGDYSTTWDGRNRGGRFVARGIYFIKVVAPGINEIRKVLVVK